MKISRIILFPVMLIVIGSCGFNSNDAISNCVITKDDLSESTVLSGKKISTEQAGIRNFIPGPSLYLENGQIVFSDLNARSVYLTDNVKFTRIIERGDKFDEIFAIDKISVNNHGFSVIAASDEETKILFLDSSGIVRNSKEILSLTCGLSLYKNGFTAIFPLIGLDRIVRYYSGFETEKWDSEMVSSSYQKYSIPENNKGNIVYQTLLAEDRDYIVVTNRLLNYFARYNEQGQLVNQVNINDAQYKELNLKAPVFAGDKLINNDIAVDDNGYLFLAKFGRYEERGRVDVYTGEGRLLDILLVDEEAVHISCNANRLVVADSKDSLSVYLYDYTELVDKWNKLTEIKIE